MLKIWGFRTVLYKVHFFLDLGKRIITYFLSFLSVETRILKSIICIWGWEGEESKSNWIIETLLMEKWRKSCVLFYEGLFQSKEIQMVKKCFSDSAALQRFKASHLYLLYHSRQEIWIFWYIVYRLLTNAESDSWQIDQLLKSVTVRCSFEACLGYY